MGKRIIDTTYIPNAYNMLSQTPKNIVRKNYYLQTLQDKVDADWEYRYNVVDIEQEMTIGAGDYSPLEVVVQSIKNDKGKAVSDDIMGLVFRDILYDFRLGTKFRFSRDFNVDSDTKDKSVWLAMNKYAASPTSRAVVNRCNGTIGSIYIDEKGNSSYHYEEAVCANSLSATAFNYNNVIISPSAQLTIIVQHNKYTKQYYINERFIVGYDQVYKVTAIDKYNSLKTYQPDDVDLVILYANLDEISDKDNFQTRIAYNDGTYQLPDDSGSVVPVPTDYRIAVTKPLPLPSSLGSASLQIGFVLYKNDLPIECDIVIDPSIEGVNVNDYVDINRVGNDNEFVIKRLRFYNRKPLKLSVNAEVGGEVVANTVITFELKGV